MADFGDGAHLVSDFNLVVRVNSDHILYITHDDINCINTIHLTNGTKLRVWQKDKTEEIENGEV